MATASNAKFERGRLLPESAPCSQTSRPSYDFPRLASRRPVWSISQAPHDERAQSFATYALQRRAGDAGDKRKSEGERSKAQDFDLLGFVAPRTAMQSFRSAAFGGTNLKLSKLPG